MFTIHFCSEETGENANFGLFYSKEEAFCSRHWDYPGYGHQKVVEISDEDALKIILDEINEEANELLWEMSDVDEDCAKGVFDSLKQQYVSNKNPGWKILAVHMPT